LLPLTIVTAVEWTLTSRQPQPKEAAPPKKLSEMSDVIDKATFDQILEMDDDEDMDFSKGIVYGFFDQAETTFDKMDKALYVLVAPC
jgi:osomolarity two-component system phosphorelay intermediate protein YPD1